MRHLSLRTVSATFARLAILTGVLGLGGCLADTAEDTDLPWASGTKWEGMAPLAPSVMDRYD